MGDLFAGPAFLGDGVYEVSEPIFASLLAAGFDPEHHPSIAKIIPHLSNHDPAVRHRRALHRRRLGQGSVEAHEVFTASRPRLRRTRR